MDTYYVLFILFLLIIATMIIEAIMNSAYNPSCVMYYKCTDPDKCLITVNKTESLLQVKSNILRKMKEINESSLWRVALFMAGIITLIICLLSPLFSVLINIRYICALLLTYFIATYTVIMFFHNYLQGDHYQEIIRIINSVH